MVGKVFMVVGIVIAIALCVFIYQATVHPKAVGLPSWFGGGLASSSIFNFNLSSEHAPQGPQGLPSSPPPTSTRPVVASPSSSAPAINPQDIPAGYTLAQLSPYFRQIRLGTISAGSRYYYGTIVLNTHLNPGENLDITGWQIKTNGSGEYIPKAVALYDPSGLTPETDIVVRNGDIVSLYSSSAPINLRLNKCIGYVAHMNNFTPALPQSCPLPSRSALQNFTGACQNYIYSLGSCQAPDLSSPSIPRTDYACKDYLENNFNYKSCFAAHVSDADFLSNQVWIWTGSNVVDPYHDTVKLIDQNGLLVDIYSY